MDNRAGQFVASQFLGEGEVVSVQGLGDGLINDTFLVTTDSADRPRFVLQRINAEVFPFPDRIMANLERLSRYLAGRMYDLKQSPSAAEFRLPSLILSADGKNCYIGESGDYWRALTYVENSYALDRLESPEDAAQVGFALGCFHNQVRDLDAELMEDSLPGFHMTPLYFSHYERLAGSVPRQKLPGNESDRRFCEEFVNARGNGVSVLEKARQDGHLKSQVIHGDPKLSNILFGVQSRRALSLVDLDTVKSGLIHYDIGDCLRSCCNKAGESPEGVESAGFDLDICEAILKRYFHECGAWLRRSDVDYLYDAIRLLPLELGLRFLSDYLEVNRYFKVETPDQNLARALVQFNLVRSVERQEPKIRQLIRAISSQSFEN